MLIKGKYLNQGSQKYLYQRSKKYLNQGSKKYLIKLVSEN